MGIKNWLGNVPDNSHKHNMKILCQGREDNPVHTDAFNVLIKNLKEKNPIWSRTTLDCERSVTRTLLWKKIAMATA